jgi:hypothetical protein
MNEHNKRAHEGIWGTLDTFAVFRAVTFFRFLFFETSFSRLFFFYLVPTNGA